MALRTPRFDSSDDSNINISPLIDVIFILLIFFVVTMSFSENRALKMEKPLSSQAETLEKTPLGIGIDKDGTLMLEGKFVSAQTLRRMLLNRAQFGDFDVAIQAHAAAPVQTLVDVMDCAKACGAKKTYVSASHKK